MKPFGYSAPSGQYTGSESNQQARPTTPTQRLERVLESVRAVEDVVRTSKQESGSKPK